MIYEAEILAALEAAPDTQDITTLLNASNEAPDVLFVLTTTELGTLMNDLYLVLGSAPDADRIAGITRHEGQHQSASHQVGATATRLGLRLFNYHSSSRSVNYIPFLEVSYPEGEQPSSLELASVAAHPVDPSEYDIDQIIGYGFESVEHVAELARANNRLGLKLIPIPLSS